MEVTVKLNHLRITPRKVRQVANLIRGMKADKAQYILKFSPVKPAKSVLKLLNSGIAAAEHDFSMEGSNLFISRIMVNEGSKMKRFRPVSRGSAHPFWRRNSHVILTLAEINPTIKKEKKEETKKEEIKEIKKERPKFEKKEIKAPKTQGAINKMFRRKSV